MVYKIDRVGPSWMLDTSPVMSNSAASTFFDEPYDNQQRIVVCPSSTVFREFGSVNSYKIGNYTLAAVNYVAYGQAFDFDISEGESVAVELQVHWRSSGVADLRFYHAVGELNAPPAGNWTLVTSDAPQIFANEQINVGSGLVLHSYSSLIDVVVRPGKTYAHWIEAFSLTGGAVNNIRMSHVIRGMDASRILKPYDPVR